MENRCKTGLRPHIGAMFLRFLIAVLSFHFAPSPPPLPVYADETEKAFAETVVALVNGERIKAGCRPLTIEARLTSAARLHSSDMARLRFFAHESKDGRQPWDRARSQGYGYRILAENIAAGYRTPGQAVDGWMHSPGHRANILNCDLTETGVGFAHNPDDTPSSGGLAYYRYWTQDFGKPAR